LEQNIVVNSEKQRRVGQNKGGCKALILALQVSSLKLRDPTAFSPRKSQPGPQVDCVG
jgi:hypothetical protein